MLPSNVGAAVRFPRPTYANLMARSGDLRLKTHGSDIIATRSAAKIPFTLPMYCTGRDSHR